MDFESAKRIIEKYKPKGELSKEDRRKLLEYCIETRCERCKLRKHYRKCPLIFYV